MDGQAALDAFMNETPYWTILRVADALDEPGFQRGMSKKRAAFVSRQARTLRSVADTLSLARLEVREKLREDERK